MAINVSTNFNLGAELPLDIRSAVNTYADLSSLVKYEGLQTYVKDEDAVYRYNGTEWVREATSVAAGTNGKIKVNGVDITVYTHPTTAGNKHLPSGGEAGNVIKCSGDGEGQWANIEISDVAGLSERLDNLLADADAMRFCGTIGTGGTVADWNVLCSMEYQNGDTYKVITEGNYAGRKCEVGDMLICVGEEHIGGESELDWTVVQANIDGAVTNAETAVTAGTIPVFSGVTGKVIESSGVTPEEIVAYTNQTPIVAPLGGIEAGETFENTSIQEVLNKLLYPYTKPTVSLTATANGGGVYEKGTSVSPTFTVVVAKKSNVITSLGLYSGSELLASNVTVNAEGGTQTGVVLDSALTATASVTAKVGDGKSTVTSGAITYTFVDPFYWGAAASAPTTSDAVKALTKAVQTKGTKTVTYTTTTEKGRYCFCYPASYGNMAKVLDGNGFDNTADFTLSTVEVTTAAGSAVTYNVYTYNNTVVPGSMAMTFSF